MCKVEEKWVKINFYKFIGCIGENKKDEYNFWVIFQQFKKKKFCSRSAKTVLGHCPNCIVNLYCKPCNCIARERAGKIVEKKNKFVLQYHFCIAKREP